MSAIQLRCFKLSQALVVLVLQTFLIQLQPLQQRTGLQLSTKELASNGPRTELISGGQAHIQLQDLRLPETETRAGIARLLAKLLEPSNHGASNKEKQPMRNRFCVRSYTQICFRLMSILKLRMGMNDCDWPMSE